MNTFHVAAPHRAGLRALPPSQILGLCRKACVSTALAGETSRVAVDPTALLRRLRNSYAARGAQMLEGFSRVPCLVHEKAGGHQPGAADSLPAVDHDSAPRSQLFVEPLQRQRRLCRRLGNPTIGDWKR
jgi:hypothetical protein